MKKELEDIIAAQNKRRYVFDVLAFELFLALGYQLPLSKIKEFLREFFSKVHLILEIDDPLEMCKAVCDLQDRYTQPLILDQLVLGLYAALGCQQSIDLIRSFVQAAFEQELPLPDIDNSDEVAKLVVELRKQYINS